MKKDQFIYLLHTMNKFISNNIVGAFYVDVKHIKKKEPPKRRDYKISMYGRVQKPKQPPKGTCTASKSGKISQSPRAAKPKGMKGDNAEEGATVPAKESKEGAVGGAVAAEEAPAANNSASHTSSKSSQNTATNQKFRRPNDGSSHDQSTRAPMVTSSNKQSRQSTSAKSASQKNTSHKVPDADVSPRFKFQSRSSSPHKSKNTNQNEKTRKSHAVTHKDEPRVKKAKTSTHETEHNNVSKLPVFSMTQGKAKKSGIPKMGMKKEVLNDGNNSTTPPRDQLYQIPDVEVNGTSTEDTTDSKSPPPSAALKQLDLRKKLMLHKSESDHKLVDEDAVSLCSNMAVRGSVCNSNDDLSPSDFGSDCLSETSSQHDFDGQNCPSLDSQDQQALSRDDGYSSNRTLPDDYSPQIERLLEAVDAVHFEPEPLISTFDVVFEPPNQD